MKKDELLKLLNKYGFYSYKKEPFLYDGKEGMGFVYTIKTNFYGNLTRIFIPEDVQSAESFLLNYYDYKKNQKKYDIILDDYKGKNPKITFEKKDQEKIEELDITKEESKNHNYIKKIKRTLNLLLQIVEQKIKVQSTTYQNLMKFTNEFIEKKNELTTKIANYEKKKPTLLKKVEKEPIEEQSLDEWYELLEVEDEDVIKESIYTLIDFIKNLEIDDGLLKNKYELIKLPIEISVVKEKIDWIDKNLQKKKGIFGKKENMSEQLKNIEEKSPLKNIVSFDHYKENELARIEEKYAVIPDLDIRTIGDYIIEFDNLKVTEPIIEEHKPLVSLPIKEEPTKYTYEEVIQNLEESYYTRPKEEQDLLVSYVYLSKYILQSPKEKEAIEEFMNCLKNPNNIMMQVKYFKNINIQSVTECMKSIEKITNQVLQLTKTPLLDEINVFFKDEKRISEKSILKTSSKRLLSPIQHLKNNDCSYIAKAKKNIEVLFVGDEIVLDSNDDTLSLKTNTPYILIDLQKNQLENENSDIIKVVDYEMEKETEEKITTVNDLISVKVNLYKEIEIERKEK